MSVYRIYVEKKPEFAVEAQSVLNDLQTALRLSVTGVRILNRYDADHLTEEAFQKAIPTVFSEPAVDVTYDTLPECTGNQRMFAVEYLPGQFDQRADSCEQCIQILLQGERCRVRTAQIYIISGNMTDAEFQQIQSYLINPVERRKASLDKPETLNSNYEIPTEVKTLHGFCDRTKEQLDAFIREYGLAMDLDDIQFCQDYFKNTEHRDPTITEIRMIDTYWSDHCRHTTFSTNIEQVEIGAPYIQKTYDAYLNIRHELGRDAKPITLMDMATLAVKKLKADGKLNDLDESEEINACSVKIKVDVAGREEDWILMFKNETHNHPTEIEPFGGAATCLGGAIRDPLSGRSYVYQAMRVTGAANPLVPVEDTIAGKLPQRKITIGAASGYSSYGNQIGLATGHVSEVYHPGYMAKRMEIGAVLGAAPASNIRREAPIPGDVVILLGGKTGRDGCGGATGSSKSHTIESLESCGAEVQKGNAPEERKLQRLFRDPYVTQMIKRCNDFGAGGVSVAIGELTDGLEIDLNAVPKKYDGLDGTEIAISESQERMAVVVAKEDAEKFLQAAGKENLEATIVAEVKAEPRLKMHWNGKNIVNLSREFLNSNGAAKYTDVVIPAPKTDAPAAMPDCAESWKELLSNLNVCSQKGLVEMFDSTIGAGTVLMPFGGAYQLTPSQAMAAKIPVLRGETNTCSLMGWGYNPLISERSPYHGAMCAVVESVAKIVAAGGSWHHCWLTFQEYFEHMNDKPERWGKPLAALLGALDAQMGLGIASIGGKDSMSGSFEQLDVPPTLVSFATAIGKASRVVSTEFKKPESTVVLVRPIIDPETGCPNFFSLKANYKIVENMIEEGMVASACSVGYGGIAEALFKMGLGNRIGFKMRADMTTHQMFEPMYGSIILEMVSDSPAGMLLGETTKEYTFESCGEKLDMAELQEIWESKLEPVYPYRKAGPAVEKINGSLTAPAAPKIGVAKPKVIIPVFPGTNCEYDTAKAFARAGADPEILVVRNLTPADVAESCKALVKAIDASQIVMLPGGFSGGDEPDGSAKFIASFFRNPAVTEAVRRLLQQRDGLMLGICNGFQALIKLGLVPYGDIRPITACDPTLTFNTIGRHQSMLVHTRVASTGSPWLSKCEVGEMHTIAISHGEGRFVAPQEVLDTMLRNSQVATQYVDLTGVPTMDQSFNPNGSVLAIEGITSPDGCVFGKMGHSERSGEYLYKNVTGDKYQPIFEGGVDYFKV